MKTYLHWTCSRSAQSHWHLLLQSLALLLVGCGGARTSGAVCPDGGTALNYANFGQGFISTNCLQCHNEMRASDGYQFGTQQLVQTHLNAIDSSSASGPARTNTRMPQGMVIPTMDERQKLGVWLACGAH